MTGSIIVDDELSARLAQVSKALNQINTSEIQGKDSDQHILKLALAHQAFERWRKSVKIVKAADQIQGEDGNEPISDSIVSKIKEVVTNIKTAIGDARLASEFSEVKISNPEGAEDATEGESIYALATERIRNRMQIAYEPEDAESASHWKLIDGGVLKQLAEELSLPTRRLTLSLPPPQTTQSNLALSDLSSIAPSGDAQHQSLLSTLQRASSGLDPVFYQAIQDSQGSRHVYEDNTVGGEAVATYGDHYLEGFKGEKVVKEGGHTYRRNTMTGQAKAHYGDSFGGWSFED